MKESVSSAGSVNSLKKSGKCGQRAKTITQTAKLTKVVIKKFPGSHVEYHTFRNRFEASIHSYESLNGIENPELFTFIPRRPRRCNDCWSGINKGELLDCC